MVDRAATWQIEAGDRNTEVSVIFQRQSRSPCRCGSSGRHAETSARELKLRSVVLTFDDVALRRCAVIDLGGCILPSDLADVMLKLQRADKFKASKIGDICHLEPSRSGLRAYAQIRDRSAFRQLCRQITEESVRHHVRDNDQVVDRVRALNDIRVSTVPSRRGQRWIEPDDYELCEPVTAGERLLRIARQLARSRGATRSDRSRMGLRRG